MSELLLARLLKSCRWLTKIFFRSLQYLEARSEVPVAINLAINFNQQVGDYSGADLYFKCLNNDSMSDLDFSNHLKINSSHSRRLEEVLTDDYPGRLEQEQKIKPGKDKEQNQNKEPVDSELSKIKPRIQDCGLNPVHS